MRGFSVYLESSQESVVPDFVFKKLVQTQQIHLVKVFQVSKQLLRAEDHGTAAGRLGLRPVGGQ